MWESGVWPLPRTVARGRHCLHHQKFLVRLLCEASCPSRLSRDTKSTSLTSQFLCFCSSSLALLSWVSWALQGWSVLAWTLSLPHLSLEENAVSLVSYLGV